MLEPGYNEKLDIKKEISNVPQSETSSSSCTFQHEDTVELYVKAEDSTSGYFDSNTGHYEKAQVVKAIDSENTFKTGKFGIALAKEEPGDCKPIEFVEVCQNPVTILSC